MTFAMSLAINAVQEQAQQQKSSTIPCLPKSFDRTRKLRIIPEAPSRIRKARGSSDFVSSPLQPMS